MIGGDRSAMRNAMLRIAPRDEGDLPEPSTLQRDAYARTTRKIAPRSLSALEGAHVIAPPS